MRNLPRGDILNPGGTYPPSPLLKNFLELYFTEQQARKFLKRKVIKSPVFDYYCFSGCLSFQDVGSRIKHNLFFCSHLTSWTSTVLRVKSEVLMAAKVSNDDLQMRNRWPIRERFIKSWDTEKKNIFRAFDERRHVFALAAAVTAGSEHRQ